MRTFFTWIASAAAKVNNRYNYIFIHPIHHMWYNISCHAMTYYVTRSQPILMTEMIDWHLAVNRRKLVTAMSRINVRQSYTTYVFMTCSCTTHARQLNENPTLYIVWICLEYNVWSFALTELCSFFIRFNQLLRPFFQFHFKVISKSH